MAELNTERHINLAAAYVHSKNRDVVEKDDLIQEGRMWVFTHPAAIQKYRNDVEWGSFSLNRELVRVLRVYSRKQKAMISGFEMTDEQYYSTKIIEAYLPRVIDNDFEPVKSDSVGKTTTDPAVAGDDLAQFLDVKRAWYDAPLSDRERWVLLLIYDDGLSQDSAAGIMEIDQSAVSRAVKSALGKLQAALGGAEPKGCPYDCECHEGKLRTRPGGRVPWVT